MIEHSKELIDQLNRVVDVAGEPENQISTEHLTEVMHNIIVGAFTGTEADQQSLIVMLPVNALAIVAELLFRRRQDAGRHN